MKTIYLIIGVVLIVIVGVYFWSKNQKTVETVKTSESAEYNPVINPTDFVSKVDHEFFTLTPGTKFTYEKKTDEGVEKDIVEVTNQKKEVQGISTTVVWDRVWLNDELIEETYDWYAQDIEGNVWYFGEEVSNFEDGKLKDHKGAWEAGVNGAKAGIIMKADPQVGDSYRQEYYQGEAEDMADVIALNKTVTVTKGTYAGCLQTRDWSMIDENLNEYKYYCPAVGFVVLEEEVAGGSEKVELVDVSPK